MMNKIVEDPSDFTTTQEMVCHGSVPFFPSTFICISVLMATKSASELMSISGTRKGRNRLSPTSCSKSNAFHKVKVRYSGGSFMNKVF